MKISTILFVGTGGFMGSIARYVMVKMIDGRAGSVFPYGTLSVNLAGSLILGIIFGYIYKENNLSENWRLFLMTGFCGGFTTFSAFAFENVNLLQQKLAMTSFTYTLLSIVLGFTALFVGMIVGKILS